MVWMEGGLVSARSELNHTQLGRAGLAWPEAGSMRRGAG